MSAGASTTLAAFFTIDRASADFPTALEALVPIGEHHESSSCAATLRNLQAP